MLPALPRAAPNGEVPRHAKKRGRDWRPVDLDEDDLTMHLQVMRQTMDRIGWVADVALRKLGDTGSFARAEGWMLPELR